MHWSVQEGDVKSRNNCDCGFTYAWDFGSISFHFFAHITKATRAAERSVENCVYGTELKPQKITLLCCYGFAISFGRMLHIIYLCMI